MLFLHTSLFLFLLAVSSASALLGKPDSVDKVVEDRDGQSLFSSLQLTNLRIEGLSRTIYEAPILSGPRNITTPSGGTHACTGTNNGANPKPGNTPTAALDAASDFAHFTYSGTFFPSFDDFLITRIAGDSQTPTQFWALLVNGQFSPVGGCQYETQPGDHILWAIESNTAYFLSVTPTFALIQRGKSLVVTVTDSVTGVPIPGALIAGVLTDAKGKATLKFNKKGIMSFKATRDDSIRSNRLVVEVV